MERQSSAHARLVRLGFHDPRRVARLLESTVLGTLIDQEEDRNGLLRALAETADPDAAALGLVRLLEGSAAAGPSPGPDPAPASDRELRETVDTPGPRRERLLAVLGASVALADHLAGHPHHWTAAADATPREPAARTTELVDAVSLPARGERSAYDALRIAYREQLLAIAALDLVSPDPRTTLPDTAAALADLAAAALEAALAIAREENPDAVIARLAVLGMGKCGGRELNYISDVDVVFVAEPVDGAEEEAALAAAARLAAALMRACTTATAEGSLWEVDAALRPEGRQGPLVRTLASHREYYRRWAKTWEFQALLKARHVAGDRELGDAYLEMVSPLVWQAAGRDHFVEDVQAMRRRVEAHVPAAEAGRQLKLGPGGLRDVEFSVQLLQLVHGRTDESLRSRTTLDALAALSARGYVGRADAARLDEAYRFLRSLEHRIQVHRMRRTHLMPTGEADIRRLGRSLHLGTDAGADLRSSWQEQAREVRRIHEKLFYRPLLAAAARLSSEEARLTPRAAQERLLALGFRDPNGALRHLEELTRGVGRTAAIHRQLLPVLLGWFADEADPDAGLLAYRRVSESLGRTPWYAKMLRDSGQAAERLAHVLARSRFAGDLLIRMPDAVRLFGEADGLIPLDRVRLTATMRSAFIRKEGADAAVEAVRVIRRQELFRIAVADLIGHLDAAAVADALTDLAEALLESALQIALDRVAQEHGAPAPVDIAIIGMGRLGGRELGYGSDADVVFVHRPHPGADEAAAGELAASVVVEVRRLLGPGGPDPHLALDVDLRPEGKAGPLTRTIEGYRAYYERWAQTWEFQALLRARPVAGDQGLGAEFVALIDPWRYPAEGLAAGPVREIRRLKARMESERLPRGVDPKSHVKLGPGGISDVEWTVQLIQLNHAGRCRQLRTTRTLPALRAAVAQGLVTDEDARMLAEAWTLGSRIRDAGMLWRGRPLDALPTDIRDREGISRILGHEAHQGQVLVDEYRRDARRARVVTERLFYGRSGASA